MARLTAVPSRRPAVIVAWTVGAIVAAVVLAALGAWAVTNRADTIHVMNLQPVKAGTQD